MAEKTPKKTGFSLLGFDAKHYRQTEGYVQAIDALYGSAVNEYSRLVSGMSISPDKVFSFDDYPATKQKAQQIVNQLASKMQAVIVKGSREQWLYACKKNDEFLNSILNTSKVPKKVLSKYQDRNLDALDAFQKRKINGLDLSQRIWNYSGQMKTQMELGIDIALGEGKSAQALSKELRQYLVDPDKLFRRVRDKHGNLVLSKAAKAFHPGQGKYRSSYKNAMRLTRSEINMAYRESDQLRWQQLDFVVGFEVKLSNNHTLNGVPFVDICDELVGKYPKNFKFKGWHPQCRCIATPILQDRDEFNDDELAELRAALKGTEYKKLESRNKVTDLPEGFKKWVENNAERSAGWKSQPYFIRDNYKGGTIAGGLKFGTQPMPAAARTTPTPAPAPPVVKKEIKLTPVDTPEDVRKETLAVGSDWFHRGFNRLEVDRDPRNNGSTDRSGTIWLSRDRLDKTVSGIRKIKRDEDINFGEADALATYWHEITHNRNTQPRTFMTPTQRTYMELANEFVARNTLPEFYTKMGAKKTPFPELMKDRQSTGYNSMVVNYDKMIEKLGIDRNKVVDTVKDNLFNNPYTDQVNGLVQAIHINKPKNSEGKLLTKTEIKSLIKRCTTTSSNYFEDILQREFKIKGS